MDAQGGKNRFWRSGHWGEVATLLIISLAIPVVVALSLLAVYATNWLDKSTEPKVPKAAIVDQLSLTFPNPGFVEEATETLEQAGYIVDYYPGEAVTVEFYRTLPTRGYNLIILRVHSALMESGLVRRHPVIEQATIKALRSMVFLFTSEPYSRTRYVEEQKKLRLLPVSYSQEQPEQYFGITPDFIAFSMEGDFDKTTIILMGCNGLTFDYTASVLVEKGAQSVVGWDTSVSSSHTDATTEQFLRHFVSEKLPLRQAVAKTVAEVGRDPSYGSQLLLYQAKE